MAKWNDAVITTAGMALSATTLAGQKIKYTHVQTTNADLSQMTEDEIKAMTAFDNVVQDLNVGTVSVQDDHTVNIPVQITNQDIDKDYSLYGMALYAEPADGGEEIIYSIIVATVPDLIPAKGGSTVTGTDFNFKTHVGDASKVDITVIQTAGVTNEQLTNVLKDYPKATEISSNYPKDTDVVHKAGAETITGAKTFAVDPVNAKNQPYITKAEVPATDLSNYLDKGTAGKTYETQADATIAHKTLSAPNLIDVATDDWISVSTGEWNRNFPYAVEKGKTYTFSAELESSANSYSSVFIWTDVINQTTLSGAVAPSGVIPGQKGIRSVTFTAPETMTVYCAFGAVTNNDPWSYRHAVLTETDFLVTYEQAQANRHGWNGVDAQQDIIGGRNLLLNTDNPSSSNLIHVIGNAGGNSANDPTLSFDGDTVNVTTPGGESFYRYIFGSLSGTNMHAGKTYIISGYAHGDTSLYLTPRWDYSMSGATTYGNVPITDWPYWKFKSATEDQYFEYKYTIPQNAANVFASIQVYVDTNRGDPVKGLKWSFKDLTLQEATVATGHMPAPEDLQQAMTLPNSYQIDSVDKDNKALNGGIDFATLLVTKYNRRGVWYIRDGGTTNPGIYLDTVVISESNYWYAYGAGRDGIFYSRQIIKESDGTINDSGWVQNATQAQLASYLGRNPSTGKATQPIDFSGTNKLTVNGGMPFVFDPNGVSADEATAKSASANDDFIHFTYDD